MPSDHGRRLENFQGVAHAGHQAIETSEDETIDIAEGKAPRRLTPQHVELMAKDKDFGLQRRARPEESDHKQINLSRSSIALNIARFAGTASRLSLR